MELYEAVSPLDFRYYGGNEAVMKKLMPYVSEAGYVKYQAKVEVALVRTLAKHGICSHEIADEVERAVEEVTATEVYEEQSRIRHNIRSLVNVIKRKISPEAQPYIHLFATSADILDTATTLRFKDLTQEVILPDLIEFENRLIQLARNHAETVQIGRTHGQHAEPITFGYAIALYVSRIGNRIELIDQTSRNLRGQFSGAVGAFNGLALITDNPEQIEAELLSQLGLKASDTHTSTQCVEPEFITDLAYAITSTYTILANFADDMRHLYRTEIAEVGRKYDPQLVGSSTMPHKVNPEAFENVKSMWKAYMPRMITVLMDGILEHQRDLTNSASSRFLTELFTAFDYSIYRLNRALAEMDVKSERMQHNLESSANEIIAEPIYLLMAYYGLPDAYDYTRTLVAQAHQTKRSLVELLWEDETLQPFLEKLTDKQRQILHHPTKYIGASIQRTHATCDEWEERSKRVLNHSGNYTNS
ncbi:adenylosuccinate lyase [Candidatus Poribacteria bacterium]|nr:adenylosuccinate lyase [Candidatus Poribacteria bacterium]